MNYEDIYNRLRDGDHIEDKELEFIRDHAGATAEALSKMGPVFRLTRNELLWVYDRADYLITARNNYRNNKG